jgi:hypothetical protein
MSVAVARKLKPRIAVTYLATDPIVKVLNKLSKINHDVLTYPEIIKIAVLDYFTKVKAISGLTAKELENLNQYFDGDMEMLNQDESDKFLAKIRASSRS